MARTCEGCGCNIDHMRQGAMVCSTRCYKRARKAERPVRACIVCRASLAHRNSKARTCSERCLNKARWARENGLSLASLPRGGCSPERAQAIADLIVTDPGAMDLFRKLLHFNARRSHETVSHSV